MKELTSLDYCKLIAWLAYHKHNVILNKIHMQQILFMCYEQYLVSHNSPLFNDDIPKTLPFGYVFPISYKRYSYGVLKDLTVSEKERFLKDKDTLRVITRAVEDYYDYFFPLLISSEKEKILGKIFNFFCKLNKEGWDGYNACPIERDSYLNARYGENAADNTLFHLPETRLQAYDACLLQEVAHHPYHADKLRNDRCRCRAADTPAEVEDEDRGENNVAHHRNHRSQHRFLGIPRGTHDVV